jgi:aspartate aminotransferase
MVNLCTGTPRFIQTKPQNNFKLTSADLEKSITAKTKLLILNTPSNPTGCVYSRQELEIIAKICVKNNIYCISDEIYEKLIYDGLKHYSLAGLNEEIKALTITVNGLSKSYAMTGWRIGYLAARQEIVDAISRLQDHSTSNPTSIAQKAAIAALRAPDDFSIKLCAEFGKRRNYLISRLSTMPKIGYCKPEGAFYIFCDIARTGLSSSVFCGRLLEEILIAMIPGDSFGRDDYVRMSFAANVTELTKAMDRLETWLKKI